MRNIIRIGAILTIFVLSIITIVEASSFKFTTSADKTTIQPGEQVSISLGISDIDAGELGINTIEGILEYDETIFEEVTSSSISSQNNWSITYNKEDGKFLAAILTDGVKEEQQIGKITLKVKSGVEYKTTQIKFKSIKSNDGENLIEETDKVINLTVGTKPTQQENNQNSGGTNTDTGTDDNNKQSAPTITTPLTVNKQESNINANKLPQTGTSPYLFIGAVVLMIAATIGYICYKMTY